MMSQEISFSHVQLFVDALQELVVYKELEQSLNQYHEKIANTTDLSIEEKQRCWAKANTSSNSKEVNGPFVSHGRDIVTQLMVGFGFRVTRVRNGNDTRSVVVTTPDPNGAQFIVTAVAENHLPSDESNPLFSRENFERFMKAHNGKMGIGVLSFACQNVQAIKARYEEAHPGLVDSYVELGQTKILEVFAYYRQHAGLDKSRVADPGTILRFVECNGDDDEIYESLGFKSVQASFSNGSVSAYSDHWVSNVFSRTEFLDTLQDTLGFFPQANFNAGVVAAGEAQIESTVTGNRSTHTPSNKAQALADQSQVYLPINNALSAVGHVHGFLSDLGQGVQHVASRVENLVDFVQQTNDMRAVTGEGFSFLSIPRSYYGVLSASDLENLSLSRPCVMSIMQALQVGNGMQKDGSVGLDLCRDSIDRIISQHLPESAMKEYIGSKSAVLDIVSKSRYKNMYALLGNHVSEPTYMAIVRNQILVDIQGEDMLYQIFTCNILQRKAGDEAPFLEFIQRVCSECLDEDGCPEKIRPGCGGFGIRNFLTLFLSIEVSKAMQAVERAREEGDSQQEKYASAMVECFTNQLNESNPILTEISEAMTLEGRCEEVISLLPLEHPERSEWEQKLEHASERKQRGNSMLMECSARYSQRMKALREAKSTE